MVTKSVKVNLYFLVVALMAFGTTAVYAQTRDSKNYPSEQISQLEPISMNSGTLYSQPPSSVGGLLPSSKLEPNGSTNDSYTWDDFTLPVSQTINHIDWVGGYDPGFFGSGGLVLDFIIAIYPSNADGTQPDISNPLVKYYTGGNAGEAQAGMMGGIAMYNYTFKLPTPFNASGGVKYWMMIEALQEGDPDWGLAKSSGGNGAYFYRIHGDAINYILLQGDSAFSLLGPLHIAPAPVNMGKYSPTGNKLMELLLNLYPRL
jgi:hypothetical protein